LILDRANARVKNPKGKEALAEKAKVSDMPKPDASRLTMDRRPDMSASPQSSWGSITRGVVVTEYLGEGFSVAQQNRQGKNPRRSNGSTRSP
jgi:hypothetical protein